MDSSAPLVLEKRKRDGPRKRRGIAFTGESNGHTGSYLDTEGTVKRTSQADSTMHIAEEPTKVHTKHQQFESLSKETDNYTCKVSAGEQPMSQLGKTRQDRQRNTISNKRKRSNAALKMLNRTIQNVESHNRAYEKELMWASFYKSLEFDSKNKHKGDEKKHKNNENINR